MNNRFFGDNIQRLKSNRDLPFIPTVCLLVFALALRLHHVEHESLWVDELLQVSFYSRPFDQIARCAALQQQPPLDYWIGYGMNAISSTDFSLRLPSALFGVGAVFMVTCLARKVCTLPVAYGAGVLAALFPYNIYFSQEARPYSIAIFLFLALLWAVARLLSTSKGAWEEVLTLVLVSLAFLHSRGFEPLVITTVLILFLSARLAYHLLLTRTLGAGKQRAMLHAIVALGLTLVLYLFTFRTLLAFGNRYLSQKASSSILEIISAGFQDFSLRPLLMSFVFQTEPLTFPLLALLLLSPIILWRMGPRLSHESVVLGVLLVPGISLLHIFVFQAYTDMPFKPQYAFYLLPLTLILSALTFQGLWDLAGTVRSGRILRAILIMLSALMILWASSSTLAFKSFKKKEDWKDLCRYLAGTYGPGQILLFDTLVPYGNWEGNFFGFRRYYDGSSKRVVVSRIPFISEEMANMDQEPVLILYHRAEPCLTPHSLYCRLLDPKSRPDYISESLKGIDSLLCLTTFAGFHVITLKERTHHTAMDTYSLLSRIIPKLPSDSSAIEIHLARAALARALGLQDWEKDILFAEALASEKQRSKLSEVNRLISKMTTTGKSSDCGPP